MDLSRLQKALEAAPARLDALSEELKVKGKESVALESFMKAVRMLRTSWRDSDPGKYGQHWHCYKNDRKAWPRELIERSKTDPEPAAGSLCAFAQLDAVNCPSCSKLAPRVCCYQQTEDGPFGDTWTKTHYALCASCVALGQVGKTLVSGSRF